MKSESPRLNMLLLSGSLMLASTATGRALPPLQHSFTGVIENIDFTNRTITLKAEKDPFGRDFLWSDSTRFREYLFVCLFQACAESLAGENAKRLASMQRAEKNIQELLDQIQLRYQQQRLDSIDEELFDVISGFEALAGGMRRST